MKKGMKAKRMGKAAGAGKSVKGEGAKKRGGGSGSGATFPFKRSGGKGSKKRPSDEAIEGMRESGLRIR